MLDQANSQQSDSYFWVWCEIWELAFWLSADMKFLFLTFSCNCVHQLIPYNPLWEIEFVQIIPYSWFFFYQNSNKEMFILNVHEICSLLTWNVHADCTVICIPTVCAPGNHSCINIFKVNFKVLLVLEWLCPHTEWGYSDILFQQQ